MIVCGGLALLVIATIVCFGAYFEFTAPKPRPSTKPAVRVELSDEEMSNFSWLDTCPDCGKVDHHPFTPIELTGRQYAITSENASHLRVVERTCTRPKCSFTWYQK